MTLKHLLSSFMLLIYFSAFAGVPMLVPEITVQLESGEQVTLYKDSEDKKLLYIKPKKLKLKEYKKGNRKIPAFNVPIVRGIEDITLESSMRDHTFSKVGRSGYIDAVFELTTGVDDIEGLRQMLGEQYPEYANHRISLLPIKPGSASITLTRTPEGHIDKAESAVSGTPVSSEYGGVIAVRLQLSEIDALIILESIEEIPFTTMFDVQYQGDVHWKLPNTKVTVKANRRKIYEYVNNHFKAKGGIAFWSFRTDIQKIREKLEKDGELKVKLDDNHGLGHEYLNNIADKYIESFVLKEMFEEELKLDGKDMNSPEIGTPDAPKKAKWISLSTEYNRKKIEQFEDVNITFQWELGSLETIPINANADISGIGPSNVTIVDTHNSFFSYRMMGVEGISNTKVLKSDNLGHSTFNISIIGDQGSVEKRVAVFSPSENKDYVTVYPAILNLAYDRDNDKFVKEKVKKIVYDFEYIDDHTHYVSKGNSFEIGSEYDVSFIGVDDWLKYKKVVLRSSIFSEKYPNLDGVNLTITSNGDDRMEVVFSEDKTESDYVVLIKNLNYSANIMAEYIQNNEFLEEVEQLDPEKFDQTGKSIFISSKDIPKLLEYGR